MDKRRRKILKEGIKDFIRTGKSITSGRLYKEHDFGIKPAMIRRELHALDEAGYLRQFHPSGGRYPTNKAYNLFVKELIDSEVKARIRKKRALNMLDAMMEGEGKVLARDMADYLDLLSVVYEPSRGSLYNSGLKDLFDQVEADEKKELSAVVSDFELLSERLQQNKKWWKREDRWPRAFIGNSPITESKHLSVIAHRFSSDKDNLLIMAIGPRRMDYRKPISLFKYIEENI